MNYSIAIPLYEFNINNVILKDKTINKLIPNSTFCKLMYSNEICHITGIPLYYDVKLDHKVNKKIYDSYKASIKIIERDILNTYSPNTIKTPNYKLYNYVLKNITKMVPNTKQIIVIKIIGIWESLYEYGLTYRVSTH
jgi:hypothetical protein